MGATVVDSKVVGVIVATLVVIAAVVLSIAPSIGVMQQHGDSVLSVFVKSGTTGEEDICRKRCQAGHPVPQSCDKYIDVTDCGGEVVSDDGSDGGTGDGTDGGTEWPDSCTSPHECRYWSTDSSDCEGTEWDGYCTGQGDNAEYYCCFNPGGTGDGGDTGDVAEENICSNRDTDGEPACTDKEYCYEEHFAGDTFTCQFDSGNAESACQAIGSNQDLCEYYSNAGPCTWTGSTCQAAETDGGDGGDGGDSIPWCMEGSGNADVSLHEQSDPAVFTAVGTTGPISLDPQNWIYHLNSGPGGSYGLRVYAAGPSGDQCKLLVESCNNNHHWMQLSSDRRSGMISTQLWELCDGRSPLIGQDMETVLSADRINQHGLVVEVVYRESGRGWYEEFADHLLKIPPGALPGGDGLSAGDQVAASEVITE